MGVEPEPVKALPPHLGARLRHFIIERSHHHGRLGARVRHMVLAYVGVSNGLAIFEIHGIELCCVLRSAGGSNMHLVAVGVL